MKVPYLITLASLAGGTAGQLLADTFSGLNFGNIFGAERMEPVTYSLPKLPYAYNVSLNSMDLDQY